MEKITKDSSFKRWAVVLVGGKNRQSFRVWHKTKEEAEDVATELLANSYGSLYLVMETVSMIGKPEKLPRKYADFIHNDYENVLARKAKAEHERLAGRKAMMAHLAEQIMTEGDNV